MITAKNIIFDLGGVIMNIDYQKTAQAFKNLRIEDFDELYSQAYQSKLFDKLETGKISREEFFEEINNLTKLNLSNAQIQDAWNAMLLDIPLRRLQILQQLQLHYNTFLLSNTNEIHEELFNQKLKEVCGYNSFGVFFDKIYLSHKVGIRKPDKEIFELILNENELKVADTVFIDDSLQHIESAASIGIQTIYLEKGMTIEKDVFKRKN